MSKSPAYSGATGYADYGRGEDGIDGAAPVCHPSRDVGNEQAQPESYDQMISDTQIKALNKLNNAPPLSDDSLLSQLPPGSQSDMETRQGTPSIAGNVSLPSNNPRISEALMTLMQSFASNGSLMEAQVLLNTLSLISNGNKNPQNQLQNPQSIMTTNQFTATEIHNIPCGSQTSNTSIEDNTKEVHLPPMSKEFDSMASSYVKVTNRTNIDERLADFASQMMATNDFKSSQPTSNNNLDQSVDDTNQARPPRTISKNIPFDTSVSCNDDNCSADLSQTLLKSVGKCTQTEAFTDQNADSFGGAASASSGVHSMSSGAASSLPPDEILVRKLKLPVIQWLQRKLETRIGMAWQDLANLHDWDYERITDFESYCFNSGKSPFRTLLTEPEFQMYCLCDLKKDLVKLPRKDILHDLDAFMKRHYN